MIDDQNRLKYLEAVKLQLELNIFKHSLDLKVLWKVIYDYLIANNKLKINELKKEDWFLAGLINDINYSAEFKAFHLNKTLEVLGKYELTISKTVYNIIKSHSPKNEFYPKNKAQWAIFCADSLKGLITAVALVYPSKKLADVKLFLVLKRFLKEPNFPS